MQRRAVRATPTTASTTTTTTTTTTTAPPPPPAPAPAPVRSAAVAPAASPIKPFKQLRTNEPLVPGSPATFRGFGAWIDVFDWSPSSPTASPRSGPPTSTAWPTSVCRRCTCRRRKQRSANDVVDIDLLRPIIDRAHARGMRVIAWYVPTLRGSRPSTCADLLAIASLGVEGVGVDIESRAVADVAERNRRLVDLSIALRQHLPGVPLAAVVMPAVVMEVINPSFWPAFPYREIAPAYDVWMPMSYWTSRKADSGYRDAYRYTAENIDRLRAQWAAPTYRCIRSAASATRRTTADIDGFRRAASSAGALGGSIYDYRTTGDACGRTSKRSARPPSAQLGVAVSGPQHDLGLRNLGDQPIVGAPKFGLNDDGGRAACSGRDVAVTRSVAHRAKKVGLGLDGRRAGGVGGQVCRRDAAPAESANAINSPPWRPPPEVHSCGAQSTDMTTRSPVISSTSKPRKSHSGIAARMVWVRSASGMPTACPGAVIASLQLLSVVCSALVTQGGAGRVDCVLGPSAHFVRRLERRLAGPATMLATLDGHGAHRRLGRLHAVLDEGLRAGEHTQALGLAHAAAATTQAGQLLGGFGFGVAEAAQFRADVAEPALGNGSGQVFSLEQSARFLIHALSALELFLLAAEVDQTERADGCGLTNNSHASLAPVIGNS